ncbi:hypothetical protein [Nocardia cyriacigeorgica]|nr:hypothetical protein [Nocardia cyriacigeorgica]
MTADGMRRVRPSGRFVTIATVICSATMLVFGAWMRVDPAGFARWANWPNHVHFLHDAGVFQLGIGLMMLCALWWRDALAVVLIGFAFANTFHALNHALDADLGGNGSDFWTLGSASVIAIAALGVRVRILNQRKEK